MDFKLLMAFVDEDKTDKVLDASRSAGATGATIITNARGQGLKKTIGIFGLEILSPRDVLLILVEARRIDTVMAAVRKAGKLDESLSTGIAIVLDVEQAIGLSDHIDLLAQKVPHDGS
ncbi:P-II family nitrogen regulator [Marinobacter sp. ATCH36]|uniref:P-II family nitrogen regulator n=1 Tax=Marinobacter sp. ATCH36 TaxID=2945106 RepID=UPI0020200B2E|nr:P-II family nitrogen regulator [Marinobacter sp. ATCH36]MCL7943243.1 P-II family nitrogen regulator [Marinobacter sp. ATCH36]